MRVYVSYNNFIGKFLNWQNEYNNMFDVARFTTIATSKGKVVLHVNYLFRSYIIKNIFKNVLDEVIMRWHLKGAVLPVGPRYMYMCISVLARRLMEYTIESCVLYMYVLINFLCMLWHTCLSYTKRKFSNKDKYKETSKHCEEQKIST